MMHRRRVSAVTAMKRSETSLLPNQLPAHDATAPRDGDDEQITLQREDARRRRANSQTSKPNLAPRFSQTFANDPTPFTNQTRVSSAAIYDMPPSCFAPI
jgi:hypothetical protein